MSNKVPNNLSVSNELYANLPSPQQQQQQQHQLHQQQLHQHHQPQQQPHLQQQKQQHHQQLPSSIIHPTNESTKELNVDYLNQHHQQQQQQHSTKYGKQNVSKEMLYATPLRKSDRYKIRDKMKLNYIDGTTCDLNNKLHKLNIKEKHQIDHHHHQQHQQSSSAAAASPLYFPNSNGDVNLEERRILNFLKDTTQLHKKFEMHKDFPNSKFSCLAREEHFANLVHQNVVNASSSGAAAATATASSSDYKKYSSKNSSIIKLNTSNNSNNTKVSSKNPLNNRNLLSSSPSSSSTPITLQPHQQSTDGIVSSNLECEISNKNSPDKEVNDFMKFGKNQDQNIIINREWVLKKIAMCLEQRITMKKPLFNCNDTIHEIGACGGGGGGVGGDISSVTGITSNTSNGACVRNIPQTVNPMQHTGCIILGSNGSGKTSICHSIINGNSGTRGILNRKLFGCYFVNSQDPDCHNLSIFIRSLVLQILSHSSYVIRGDEAYNLLIEPIGKQQQHQQSEDIEDNNDDNENKVQINTNNNNNNNNDDDIDNNNKMTTNPVTSSTTTTCEQKSSHLNYTKEMNLHLEEEMLISELKLCEKVAEFCAKKSVTNKEKGMIRQKSAPTDSSDYISNSDIECYKSVHPSLCRSTDDNFLMDKTSKLNVEDDDHTNNNNNNEYDNDIVDDNDDDEDNGICSDLNVNTNIIKDSGIGSGSGGDWPDEISDNSNNNNNISNNNNMNKNRIKVKSSKIPIKIGGLSGGGSVTNGNSNNISKSPKNHQTNDNNNCSLSIQQKELQNSEQQKQSEHHQQDDTGDEFSLNDSKDENLRDSSEKEQIIVNENDNVITITDNDDNLINLEEQPINSTVLIDEEISINSDRIPQPLPPKSKGYRTETADEYYEMLMSNPDILESLYADNIEKNPDECFQKAILFPLLELTPPKMGLLLLIDSIDENYINDGNLMSTLKGRNSISGGGIGGGGAAASGSTTALRKSHNIAELLSNHIHLLPKWLFIVCTAKKQNKHITKMFNGFKKITLDDLRKSHVVKDVQEYIINRLNTDFKGTINLSKDIIESLNQLYIKSNGCILYLQKVLDGIKDNFFSFREIKLIPCTLNGLYLYICQKSFNKKQFMKIRPILNILLACNGYVEILFLYNCLRTHNYTIDMHEFEKRLEYMKNILLFNEFNNKVKLFHNSFCDWLVDVKFSTKKFLCDVNEGHTMISMYYILISDILCPNQVRRFIYHLIKTGEYYASKSINLDLIIILLESRANLNDSFYTNHLNCCNYCENEFKNDPNFLPKTKFIIEKFLSNELNDDFSNFLFDFFKPNLPNDPKILKLLIETGVNNADCQLSYDDYSSINNSPSNLTTEKSQSQNIDTELADLLIISERNCTQEIHNKLKNRSLSPSIQNNSNKNENIANDSDERNNENKYNYINYPHLTDSHNIELHKGKALIHILASDGNHLLLERALKACKEEVNLEIEDVNGQTALNIAARNGHIEIVQLLLNLKDILTNNNNNNLKSINVNHTDCDGWTPLRSASWGGHTEIVKLLLEQPNCNIDLADKEERTALRAAAWSGHEDILKILIKAGADVNSVDKQGRTSLIAASYMGHYEIVEILLENNAKVNHLDIDGRSALCVAALCGSSGYSKVISCLLEYGANTDQLDNDGMSPLLVSSFEGNFEVCELLLENGADPDLADFMGRTPLWAACTAGHANVVKLLLFWGCGIDCMDSEGRTVLSIAAAQGNLETVRQLLDRGLDETHRDNAGWTPLHYAAFEGYADICVQLVESGAKIDECDNEGKTALHLAAQEGREKVIENLLNIHSGCIDQRAHDGKTAFRLACIEGHIDCINTLLKYGCDVNLKDADSRTTLYILALENKLKIVKYLLEHSNINVNTPDSEGRTALHVASWQGHVEMVRMLLTQGHADVNAMDLDCRTPLHSCAWQGNHEVMQILLFCGATSDHACKQGATALGISAQEGHEQCVSILLQYGANPYKSDHCGRTPIKLAVKSNRNNVLRILEAYTKNDVNFEPRNSNHIQKSPDKPIGLGSTVQQQQQQSVQNPNLLTATNNINATSSTQSSNFYENTMHSDASSLQKRKSVISSQSTGSSNNETPLSFTQQLQRHSRHNSRHAHIVNSSSITNSKYIRGSQKHSQILANVDEYQTNIAPHVLTNDADLSDNGCMSPLYCTPPHSPCSDISSPGQQHPSLPHFEDVEIGGNGSCNIGATSSSISNQLKLSTDHFARDTHMRIILGNNKDSNNSASKSSKRSGIATNPAVRMIRSRFDSAAQLIRRTNNMLSSNSSSNNNNNNQGSASIGIKSSTFQWRKESQM